MDSVTDILNQYLYPYNYNFVSFDGLTLINSKLADQGNVSPDGEEEIISHVSKPIRNDNLCILFCYSGEIICRMNMIEYHLKGKDLLFLNENAIVEIEVNDMNVNLIGIVIGEKYHPFNVGMKDYLSLHEAVVMNPLLHLTDLQTANIMNTCRRMVEVMKRWRDAFGVDLVKAYLKALYIYCTMAFNDRRLSDERIGSPRNLLVLRRFFDLVENNFKKERQISFYADKLCMAPKYMSQVIRSASGKLAGDWIQERVILEAKLLLLDGHHNVQQVADALNFSSQSFFGKYFKAATGMSPKAYVAANKT